MATNDMSHTFDDIDGSMLDDLNPGETVRFGIDGLLFEIDLSITHAAELRQAFEPYLDAARRTPSRPSRHADRTTVQTRERADAHAWLRENGLPVGGRGRIADPLLARDREQGRATPTARRRG
ncbi:Lsr2 family protein [Clavibacter sp. VKM Ac-2872]|uniref:histone-like nucleoid-structuring protein Lsr2 n=1 Tax=Clavibacter sp. VKM Ac-2872 TaxID=2783812 RepID=UPI00188CB80E|nr:Lsr2 family protein [Clavibacter sp. VKM Ac-2872]MBF4625829.1 Lsr2 family protein [Clavibacter sp. VKM Ac-2872]